MQGIRHIALVVPDLRAAEEYYGALFDAEIVGRETQLEDGHWYTLSPDKGWPHAEAVGIELRMVALRVDRAVLALFGGEARPGQVFAIGLTVGRERLRGIRARLTSERITDGRDESLEFRDDYGITWQLSATDLPFRTAGEISGRWLDV